MSSRTLGFVSLDAALARSQTQACLDLIQDRLPRLTCQLNILPSPIAEEDLVNEDYLAAGRDEIAFILGLLLTGRERLAVIEASDLPGRLPADLGVLCVPDRSAPFDAYLNRHGKIMDEMDPGSRIGVMSMRSRARMQAVWPDLKFEVLHGGVDRAMETHMRRSEIDGLVLPAAVTEHLGIQGIVAEIYAPEFILPGPGQGILAVIGREDDKDARNRLAGLHSEATATELVAERAFQSRMVPDLDAPVGALARVSGGEVVITGSTGAGLHRIVVNGGLDEAEAVGAGLAQQLLSHSETFADLLEGDFPDGLPSESDEDAELLDTIENGEDEDTTDPDLDDLDELRGFEDLAGVNDPAIPTADDEEEDPYDGER